MRRYRYLIAFFLLVAAAFAAKHFMAPDPFPAPGEYEAEVQLPAGSQRLRQLSARVQNAVRSDPKWYIEHLKANPQTGPGEMLPYHENLGISKKDYDLMVIEMEKISFQKLGTTKVRVADGPGGSLKISFEAPPAKKPIEMTLSADRRELTGKFGRAIDNDESVENHSSRLLGKWKGRHWKVLEGELSLDRADDWSQLDVGIGIDSEGNHLLYTSGGFVRDGQSYQADHVIRWPAK